MCQFTLTERRRFHTAIQIFKSLATSNFSSLFSYMTYFSFRRMLLVILVVMLIVYLFLECLSVSTMASELFSTEELFYGLEQP